MMRISALAVSCASLFWQPVAVLAAQGPELYASRLAAVATAGRELHASQPADTGRARLRAALHEAIEQIRVAELDVARSAEQPKPSAAAASADPAAVRELLAALLDTVVFRTDWGGAELDRLRGEYPGAFILERYAAEFALHGGQAVTALKAFDRLLSGRPADPLLHAGRARALEALGRPADAVLAWTRALDLAPADEAVFRALLRVRLADDTVAALASQIQRLRILHPGNEVLMDREIEVLHRLGRLEEAADAAQRLEQRRAGVSHRPDPTP